MRPGLFKHCLCLLQLADMIGLCAQLLARSEEAFACCQAQSTFYFGVFSTNTPLLEHGSGILLECAFRIQWLCYWHCQLNRPHVAAAPTMALPWQQCSRCGPIDVISTAQLGRSAASSFRIQPSLPSSQHLASRFSARLCHAWPYTTSHGNATLTAALQSDVCILTKNSSDSSIQRVLLGEDIWMDVGCDRPLHAANNQTYACHM